MKNNIFNKLRSAITVSALALSLSFLTACSGTYIATDNTANTKTTEVVSTTEATTQVEPTQPETTTEAASTTEATTTEAVTTTEVTTTTEVPTTTEAATTAEQPTDAEPFIARIEIILAEIDKYSGSPYIEFNGNVPLFLDKELTTTSYEYYSDLDSLGRCGMVCACIGQDLMPTEDRGSIGQIKPSGWHTVKYDIVDGKYLYNRCHLIGYQLTAENANEKNLITGTRYLNVEGMLPFENMVADYIKETGNHVMYKVIPLYDGDNLVASGVIMTAKSVEDDGDGISFCVFCYNVQPGVGIDYATGESWLEEVPAQEETTTEVVTTTEAPATTEEPSITEAVTTTEAPTTTEAVTTTEAPTTTEAVTTTEAPTTTEAVTTTETPAQQSTENSKTTYVANTNTKKFHYPDCSSVKTIKNENRCIR